MTLYFIVGASILAVFLVGGIWWSMSRSKKGRVDFGSLSSPASAPSRQKSLETTVKKSGLKIEILQHGEGSGIDRGNRVSIHYTGWLENGTQFDSSRDRGVPIEFKLGQGRVILGWEEGLRGMKLREKRRLTIPPRLGYGNQGNARIPPKSTLIFEVELVSFQ